MTPLAIVLGLCLCALPDQEAQPNPPGRPAEASENKLHAKDDRFSLHFQATVATQAHPSFSAAYSGRNSMKSSAESATSVVMDLFAGVSAWQGAEVYFQPELAGGRGLSSTLGVASFPSGEVYRVGDPTPTVVAARAFLRQVVPLGGERFRTEAGPNQLALTRDRDALTVTVGKVAVTDLVDGVPLSNDPHTHFMAWGLWASGAYDYPADTRGYTWGLAADLTEGWWSVRVGIFLEPKSANGLDMEWDITRARGLAGELEARYTVGGRQGATRVLGRRPRRDGDARLRADQGRVRGERKPGPGRRTGRVRAPELQRRRERDVGVHRDRPLAGHRSGPVGRALGRPDDEAGIGVVVSGLSDLHRRYLAAGGYGFIIGDGALAYAVEVLGELYYRLSLTREVSLGVNYQPIFNPAFNADRGPIHVFTGRAHIAF